MTETCQLPEKDHRPREYWLDLARAVAIISVSFNHALNRSFLTGTDSLSEYLQMSAPASVLKAFLYAFSRIGVPLFLMITGALLIPRNYEDKSVTNVQSMSNAAKNGTAQFATSVNYKNGRGKGTQYLYEHLRRGSFSTSDGSTLFSYTGFTPESSCAWGQKETFGASSDSDNRKNAIPVAIGYLPMGTNGWWQQ